MRRRGIVIWLAAVLATLGWVASVVADHDGGTHSSSMELIANYGGDTVDGEFVPYRTGTDMAFWGDRAILGSLDQGVGPNANPVGGFRVMDIADPERPSLLGRFACPGDQSDVSVWKDLVILSVDKPTKERCTEGADGWEGLRVISIADPANPRILGTLATRCGSHTNTVVPDLERGRLIVYVLSYPLAGRYNPADKMVPLPAGPGCNAADHGVISVVEVPLDDPGSPRLLSTPSVRPTVGCHDVTVFQERELAAAACLTESQMWDVSDPANPRIVAHVPNPPGFNLSHSTAFSNDGKTLVIGDELGGAAASPGCVTDDQRFVSGGLFFFDVAGERARAPQLRGTFKLPQEQADLFCTAHLFNVVPTRRDQDVLVSSWYTGATSVIDFTDPSRPRQIAFYVPSSRTTPDRQTTEAAAWASYWYRGVVYSNNFDEDVNSVIPHSRGLDVFRVEHPAVRRALRLPRLNPQLQEPLPRRRAGSRARSRR